jgi:hypothetical protein
MSAGIFLLGAVLTATVYRVGVPDEVRNGQAPIVG